MVAVHIEDSMHPHICLYETFFRVSVPLNTTIRFLVQYFDNVENAGKQRFSNNKNILLTNATRIFSLTHAVKLYTVGKLVENFSNYS
jgi:hypothetical protein